MPLSSDVTGETRSLYRISLAPKSSALKQWLEGPKAYTLVERYTAEVFAIYHARLPVRRTRLGRQPPPGNLQRSAYYRIDRAGWGEQKDRWMGHVGNFAPYSRVIEYGSRRRGIAGRHDLREAGLAVFGHGDASGAFTNIKKEHAKGLARKESNAFKDGRKNRVKAAKRATNDRAVERRRLRIIEVKNNAEFTKKLRQHNKDFHKARHQQRVAERAAARLIAGRKKNDPNESVEARRARLGISTPEQIAADEKKRNRKVRSDKGKARGRYRPRDPEGKTSLRLPEKREGRGKAGNRAAKRFNELIEIREKRLAAYSEGPRLRYEQLLKKEDAGEHLTDRELKFLDKYLDSLHDD